MTNITQERMEKAINYLAETDKTYGQLRAQIDGLDYRIKVAEAQAFLENIGQGTQEHIKSLARASASYRGLVDEYIAAKTEYEVIGARRKTAELITEVWRSINANQRRGSV